jgi:DNA-directed RNA polymerase subunit RPC12/RpoP
MAWFLNYYECDDCHRKWTDAWTATCDDDCPHCGARHMSPYKSTDIQAPKSKKGSTVRGHSTDPMTWTPARLQPDTKVVCPHCGGEFVPDGQYG